MTLWDHFSELSWNPQGVVAYEHLGMPEPEHKMVEYTSHKGWHHLDCKSGNFNSHTKGQFPCIEWMMVTVHKDQAEGLGLLY